MEFLAIGTAIEPVADEYQSVDPALVMTLSDHRPVGIRQFSRVVRPLLPFWLEMDDPMERGHRIETEGHDDDIDT